MDDLGGGAEVMKDSKVRAASLSNPLFPQLAINHSPPYEFWLSWSRIQHIVGVVKSRGVENADEWQRLARICKLVSRRKKSFLYREFRPLFSQPSMEYLFGRDFYPMPWEVR